MSLRTSADATPEAIQNLAETNMVQNLEITRLRKLVDSAKEMAEFYGYEFILDGEGKLTRYDNFEGKLARAWLKELEEKK